MHKTFVRLFGLLAARLPVQAQALTAVSKRSFLIPRPSGPCIHIFAAAQLPLWSRMKSKQTDIASFFGSKPKKASTTTPAAAKDSEGPTTKRKPEDEPEVAPAAAGAAAETKPAAGGKLKRLRKAGEKEAAPAAAALTKELEDSDNEAPDQKTTAAAAAAAPSSSGKRASLVVDETQAKALKAAAAAAVAEEESESEEMLEAEVSSESEPEEEPGRKSPKGGKKKAKAPAKSPVSKPGKVDGVGSLAIKAAAEHGTFDLSKIVTWKDGAPVPFGFLADTFNAIGDESKRLVITRMLVSAFRAVIATSPQELLPMVYLCTNRVGPAHEGLELGLGDATLIKALAQATGRKESTIKSDYDDTGDLGKVATASRATQKTMFAPPPLTISGVFKAFHDIASSEGAKSQERKKGMIVKLLVGAKQNEAGFVMRALQGKLRIGLAEQTVLVALAHAAALQQEGVTGSSEDVAGALENAAQVVKRVYSECPSYDDLIPALLEGPIADLPNKVHFKPGVPIKPMLAKPTHGVAEVLDKFSDQAFTCEYKYDGERAQIHVLDNGSVQIYSRNSENNTGKYPDIAALFPGVLAPGVKSVVLDAEAVAYDPVAGKILPFQVLSTRARKDVTLENVKVAVCVYVFDCLYVDGKSLLQEPLTVRREELYKSLVPLPGKFEFAEAKVSNDVEELTKFLDDSVVEGTEGLIVKTLADSYEPSKRSSHWLKLKKDYIDGVGDTFDCVPIGGWYGRGKRTGVFGSYLLAVWNPDQEEYQTICKIGTGFSEELLKDLAESMKPTVIPEAKTYYRYSDALTPDVWFDAKAVWEVKAADISISPAHQAGVGLVDETKGISIRFPRLVRVRDDKGPEDSTSPEQLAEMYNAQAVLQNGGKGKKGGGGDDEDY